MYVPFHTISKGCVKILDFLNIIEDPSLKGIRGTDLLGPFPSNLHYIAFAWLGYQHCWTAPSWEGQVFTG